ncbi:DUF5819 family protein [Kitasatospora sp. MAP5-34]|uniref:DUF5819 family protein n=1 Tax=Kitasatospora sp. MAP5-34 TaxID=3035102 RepID=UPI00247401F7|nr:DUF5819 family protein [Kitasatospora sp. MAP5-34]MDH6577067.1 hypothetical protein [Kitasatospora sp. MAP5-34]
MSETNTPALGGAMVPTTAPVPARTRALVLAALVPVVLFTAACVVYNAPASPARNRLVGPVNRVLEPYFAQDWQLFGPTPGDSVSLVYMAARMKTPSGAVVETPPVEIEDAIDRSPQDFPINPTKLPGVLLAFDETAQKYTQQATDIKKLPADQKAAAQTDLDKSFATNFLEMRRFFSAQAATLYPHNEILAVKATFKDRPIVPFSARYANPQPVEPTDPELETSWLDYVPGVAQ